MVRARVRAIRVSPNPNSPNPNPNPNRNSPKKDYMLLWGFDSNMYQIFPIGNYSMFTQHFGDIIFLLSEECPRRSYNTLGRCRAYKMIRSIPAMDRRIRDV